MNKRETHELNDNLGQKRQIGSCKKPCLRLYAILMENLMKCVCIILKTKYFDILDLDDICMQILNYYEQQQNNDELICFVHFRHL